MKPNSRIGGLDVLRGLAASFVVLWHFEVFFFRALYPQYPKPFFHFESGIYAVWLFFGISGYVIPLTLERIERPLEFVKARFMRLYPTFFVSVLLTFLVISLWRLPGHERTMSDMLVNLSMIPHVFGVKYIDDVYWSLDVEWFFYALMFFVILFNAKKYIAWLIPLTLIPLPIRNIVVSHSSFFSFVYEHFTVLWNIHYFIPGICIFHWNKERKPIFLGFIGSFILVQARMRGWDEALVCVVTTALIFAASNGKLSWLEFQPLPFLGTISYSLYLIHQDIGCTLMIQLLDRGCNPNLAVLAAVVVVVPLAAMLTFFVEKPSMRWYKKYVARNAISDTSGVKISPV